LHIVHANGEAPQEVIKTKGTWAFYPEKKERGKAWPCLSENRRETPKEGGGVADDLARKKEKNRGLDPRPTGKKNVLKEKRITRPVGKDARNRLGGGKKEKGVEERGKDVGADLEQRAFTVRLRRKKKRRNPSKKTEEGTNPIRMAGREGGIPPDKGKGKKKKIQQCSAGGKGGESNAATKKARNAAPGKKKGKYRSVGGGKKTASKGGSEKKKGLSTGRGKELAFGPESQRLPVTCQERKGGKKKQVLAKRGKEKANETENDVLNLEYVRRDTSKLFSKEERGSEYPSLQKKKEKEKKEISH